MRFVAVVGGGIGGLTAALAFARTGAEVFVFERADAFGEVGAGIQITPNAGRVLRALGVWDRLAARGVISDAVVPVDGLTGRSVARFDLSGQDPRYLFIPRPALIDVLAGACRERGVALRTGMKVDMAEGRPALPGGEMPDADLTVFADGLHSAGRAVLNGPSSPFFTGQVAWRAVVEGDMPSEARICMGPGRHVVLYPIGAGRINVVAVEERADWAAEGWHYRDDPRNLRNSFRGFSSEVRAVLGRADEVHLWGLFRHDIAETWGKGDLALVGDAAHPTLPFLAQGANLAIEDAWVLASTLARGGSLADYGAARRPRVRRAIAAANANARNYHLSGIARTAALTALTAMGKVAPNAFLSRLSWLYDHDVTAGQGQLAPAWEVTRSSTSSDTKSTR